MQTGIQISSLKPLLLTPEQVSHAFFKVKGLGCDVVQLQWIDPSVPVEHIASSLEANGLRSVSVQDFYELVREQFDYYARLNLQTGGTWLCVSRIPQRLKTREGLDLFVRELRQMNERLKTLGQRLCFHPVSADFTAVPGMNAVEYLLDAMPELELCLDLYHLNRNCADMPGFIRTYARRICMVHFKDEHAGELVPAGQGDTVWTGVVAACLEAGIPYGFVEQEHWSRDPYICLQEALNWLNEEMRGNTSC